MKFKVGDKAVYPAHGVAEVACIESKDVLGTRVDFYVLKFLATGTTLMVPTASSERAGLRGIVSMDGISNVYSILSTPHKVAQRAWNRRFREFNEKLKASIIEDVAEVLRDLWTLQSIKELSFGEKQMLEKAMELIVSEISASRGMSFADAQVEIRNRLVSLH